jgi:hypothetical protein
MFPIAHAYLLERLFNDCSPIHYLGCVWPDMLFTGPLKHAQTHKQGWELLKWTRQESREMIPFIKAAISHGTEPHGFDWYSDESYDPGAERGYAFERARSFIDRVIAATHIDPTQGWWKAHNFVEMSFEIDLGQKYPHLGPSITAACNDTALVNEVSKQLSHFFQVPVIDLTRNIREFPTTIAIDKPNSTDLAIKYAYQLQLKHGIENADISAMATIIDDIWEAIKGDREKFLKDVVSQVGNMLQQI